MGGDHHYVPPKTDGTFGLKVNWTKLAKSKSSAPSSAELPFKPLQPITVEELSTKTLQDWWNWRQWRKVSPFQQFSLSGNWENYARKNFSGRLPSATFMRHLTIGVVVVGFIASYPKNSKHLYANNH